MYVSYLRYCVRLAEAILHARTSIVDFLMHLMEAESSSGSGVYGAVATVLPQLEDAFQH